jgi:hypothetical protein
MSLLLLMLLAIPADTFTVDDDGPHADFASILDAVAAANGGDILHVQPGDYEPFVLNKNLLIMGPAAGPRPKVSGRTVVQFASGATMAGMAFGSFVVEGVAGRIILDDCTFGFGVTSVSNSTLDIIDCLEVEVQRCVIHGLDGGAGTALNIHGSRVSVTASNVVGGNGGDAHGCVGDGGDGGSALVVDESKLTVAACLVRGGQGGASCGPPAFDGTAGDGLVSSESQVIVRGAPTDVVSTGPWTPPLSSPGSDIILDGGKLLISGVAYDPSLTDVLNGGVLIDPGHAEPYLDIGAGSGAGEVLQLRLVGPGGAQALFFVGIVPGLLQLGPLELPLWLNAGQSLLIVTLVTQGAGTPVVLQSALPAGLEGLDLHVQAVFPGLDSELFPNKVVVTNPLCPVLRF